MNLNDYLNLPSSQQIIHINKLFSQPHLISLGEGKVLNNNQSFATPREPLICLDVSFSLFFYIILFINE